MMLPVLPGAMRTAVLNHAYKNYERGWDFVVECISQAELDAVIGDARTAQEAIRRVQSGFAIRVRHGVKKDIQGERDFA